MLWYFFDIIQHGELQCKPPVHNRLIADSWFNVARFVVKYQSALGRRRLRENILKQMSAGRTRTMHAWIIGAILRDADLCFQALKCEKIHGLWPKQRGAPYLKGRNELDPKGIPRELVDIIPPDYMQALCTAWGALMPEFRHDDYVDMAEYWLFALRHGYPPPPDKPGINHSLFSLPDLPLRPRGMASPVLPRPVRLVRETDWDNIEEWEPISDVQVDGEILGLNFKAVREYRITSG